MAPPLAGATEKQRPNCQQLARDWDFTGSEFLASSVTVPAYPWHLFRVALFPVILIMIYTYITRKLLKLLNGKRHHLEPASGCFNRDV